MTDSIEEPASIEANNHANGQPNGCSTTGAAIPKIDPHTAIHRKYYQSLIAVVSGSLLLAQAQAGGMAGFVLPQIEGPDATDEDIRVTRAVGSWFASVVYLGSIVGALWTGYQSNRLGRKRSMIIDVTVMLTGNLIVAFAHTFPLMLIGRALNGLAAGAIMVDAPTYMVEITQPRMRPLASAIIMITGNLGIALCYFVGALLPWRHTVLVFAGLILAMLIGVITVCPESHVWLVSKNEVERARTHLRNLRGDNDFADAELEAILENKREAELATKAASTKFQKLKHLLTDPTFRLPFLSALSLRFLGLDWGGFFIVGTFMVQIIKKTELPLDSFNAAAGLASYRVPITLLTLLYMAKVKQRPTYLSTTFITGFGTMIVAMKGLLGSSALCMASGENIVTWMPLIGLVIFYTGSCLGMSQMCFVLPSEIMPSESRSMGIGVLNFLHGISLYTAVQLYPFMEIYLGLEVVFIMFTIALFVSAVVVYKYVPETKGKSLVEIEQHYRALYGVGYISYVPKAQPKRRWWIPPIPARLQNLVARCTKRQESNS